MNWHLYVLDCDGRFYTGVSIDPMRRLEEHRAGKRRGAKFTRAASSHELVYSVMLGEHGLALRAEARLKKLPRARKLVIVRQAPTRPQLLDLLGLNEVRAEEATDEH